MLDGLTCGIDGERLRSSQPMTKGNKMDAILHPAHDPARRFYVALIPGFDYWNIYEVVRSNRDGATLQMLELDETSSPLVSRKKAEMALALLGEPVWPQEDA